MTKNIAFHFEQDNKINANYYLLRQMVTEVMCIKSETLKNQAVFLLIVLCYHRFVQEFLSIFARLPCMYIYGGESHCANKLLCTRTRVNGFYTFSIETKQMIFSRKRLWVKCEATMQTRRPECLIASRASLEKVKDTVGHRLPWSQRFFYSLGPGLATDYYIFW